MSSSHATSGGRHRLCQVWLPFPCGCIQMPGLAEAGGVGRRSGGRPVGLGVIICLGWHILMSLLSLVIHPLPLGPAALAAAPEPSLGPWRIFRCVPVSGPLECLLQAPLTMGFSLWGFVSLKCCNRTCDPIVASLPSSTPIADLASVQAHWAWWSWTWATSWGSSRSQAASPLGGPGLSRNYGWRGPHALCCLIADVLRG